MTQYNKFDIYYSFNDILGSFLSIFIPYFILYEYFGLPFIALYMNSVHQELHGKFKS